MWQCHGWGGHEGGCGPVTPRAACLAPPARAASACALACSPPASRPPSDSTRPRTPRQLAHLVTEFLQQPGIDPSVRDQFLAFMAERATR